MAGIKISDLPSAPSAQLTDVFPVDQGATTYKESNTQLLTLFKASGEALTKIDDTNVTMALSAGAPTSLLNATSLTLGWTGQLSVPRGGTGNSSFTAYSVLCAGTTATGVFQNVSGVGTANQVLVSNGAAALPTWQSVPGLVPAALTKTDDTNVTLTLGGTPATALLQATSITAGWTGTLSGTRGGTGVNNGASTITLGGSLTTVGAFASTFTMTGITGVTFPTSGTLATTSQIPTGAALTKTDDTNVTATLGGSPSTALVNAASITLGWTGQLAETRGGTAQSTYTTGDTLYSSASNTLSKLAGNITTTKQYLSQTGSGAASAAPVWDTVAGTDITGAALTKSDDTNVTLTLGGTPTTALLRAASITAGWTGTLSGTRGGTGVNNGASTITLGGSLTTSGAFASTFTMTNTTGVTFPTSGTLATTSQIPTGAALTKTDDTNVTMTLGGSPTTALVNAASMTLGWTGQLGVTRGGTGLSSCAQGDLFYGSASNTIAALAKDTNATRYLSNTGTTNNPAWAQVNAANGVTGTLPVANGGTGITSFGTGVATALGQNVTGSGGIALATSPTFVTPVLGAATATSINFGQTTLNLYQEGTWTPTDTSGASLTFSTAVGTYTRIGRMVVASCQIVYPSTVSGAGAQIGGLPFTVANNNAMLGGLVMFSTVTTLKYTLAVPNTTTANLYINTGAAILNSAMTLSTNYLQFTYFV